LTTGTKDLQHFIHLNEPDRRLYVRVLPSLESLQICLESGLPPAQIICMQGPFSEELNVALMRQFNIGLMVTKVSGKIGGFEEKAKAARAIGADLLAIQPPCEEKGWDQEGLLREIKSQWQEREKNEA
jgi:precorrin-6x reductase